MRIFIKLQQGLHHNGDEAAQQQHILCKVCVHSFGTLVICLPHHVCDLTRVYLRPGLVASGHTVAIRTLFNKLLNKKTANHSLLEPTPDHEMRRGFLFRLSIKHPFIRTRRRGSVESVLPCNSKIVGLTPTHATV